MIHLTLLLAISCVVPTQDSYSGGRITVQPVFCVPRGINEPAAQDSATLIRQLRISQARYFELLRGLDTFKLAEKVTIWKCPATIEELKGKPNGAAEFVASELLKKDRKTRWTCPLVYVVLYVGTAAYPRGGGGRPLNGGHDKGGGIVILSAGDLDSAPNFQSTLQHELGHAFGLPHVDVYGYDMNSNNSLMSYNPGHHTNFFAPSPTPGQLIPEDLRALAKNKWVFPAFRFDAAADVPSAYVMQKDVELGPMELPNPP